MAEIDHFFLARADQRALLLALRSVPQLVTDLAVTIRKQDRNGAQMRVRHASLAEGSVLNLSAHEAAEKLYSSLTGWIRVICEQRGLKTPDAVTDTLSAVAWWLVGEGKVTSRHIVALAMTEGATVGYAEIVDAVTNAKFHAYPNPPTQADVNPAKLAEAERLELNSDGIEAVAKLLGEEYRNLTANRVANLARREHIKPVRWYREIPVYRLGDVLIEHLSVPIRRTG